MNLKRVTIASLLLALAGCASQPAQLTEMPAVRPARGHAIPRDRVGTLKVYSAVHPEAKGSLIAYPHSSYRIYSEKGNLLKVVLNHSGQLGETPELINLSPGLYKVIAESEGRGIVMVPVIIQSSMTTEVRLIKTVRTITPDAFASN